jgi:hypothetical protein
MCTCTPAHVLPAVCQVYHEFKREERDMKLKERMRKVEGK